MKKLLFIVSLFFTAPAHALPVEEITSPDGLSIWYVEDKTTPSMTFSFAFNGGSELDPADKQGLTYLLANMLTEGAGDYTSSQFSQALAEKNIALSFSAGRDQISGDLKFLTAHTDSAVALTKLALTKPRFDVADLKRQQAGLLASFNQTENNPDWRATRLLFQSVYNGTPYAQSARGTPATIPAIGIDDLKAALKDKIVQSRLVIVAVGATSANDVGKMADRIFGGLPKGQPAPTTAIELKNAGTQWFSQWAAAPQAVIQFALPGIAPNDPDYPIALVLNDMIGGGGFRARLMKELRQKLGATYGISMNPLQLKAAPVLYGQGSVELSQLEPALSIIKNTIAAAQDGTAGADELNASKTYLAGAFARDLTSSGAIADFILSARLNGLPRDYYETYPNRINAITTIDLQRVAKRLFDPAQLRFAIVAPMPPAKVDKTVTDLWAIAP